MVEKGDEGDEAARGHKGKKRMNGPNMDEVNSQRTEHGEAKRGMRKLTKNGSVSVDVPHIIMTMNEKEELHLTGSRHCA